MPATPASLKSDLWKLEGDFWVHSQKNWQIVISAKSDRTETSDLPEGIDALLPGVEYLTGINLEPIHAPEKARSFLKKVSTDLAKELGGVIEDPQEGLLNVTGNAKRAVKISTGEEQRIHVLEMSWWFEGGNDWLKKSDGLIDLMNELLPESMPRRYGLYEPPQNRFAETGLDHFKAFLRNESGVVWYPQFPVLGVYFTLLKKEPIWQKRGDRNLFRSNRISLEFHSDILKQPGWEVALRRLWRAVSEYLQPFYGDVRLLGNHIYSKGGKLWSTGATERHPVKSWWWRGLPKEPALAIVIGEPYREALSVSVGNFDQVGAIYFDDVMSWIGALNHVSEGETPSLLDKLFRRKRSPKKAGLSVWPFSSNYFATVDETDYPTCFPFNPPQNT